MRKELKQILDSEFGYTLSDLDHTFEIVQRLDREKFESLMRRQAELEKEKPDLVDDIMDDLHWYGYLESFLIWHFGLLRLQGIFEGYIVSNFLSSSFKSWGLKSKLRGIIDRGYKLPDNDYHELTEWGRIRNSLSHFPPHQLTLMEYLRKLMSRSILLFVSGF